MDDRPWLKNYDQGVPQHIDYPEIILSQMLEEVSQELSGYTLYDFQRRQTELSGDEYDQRSVSGGLGGAGVEKG